jgi:hypothetical protein
MMPLKLNHGLPQRHQFTETIMSEDDLSFFLQRFGKINSDFHSNIDEMLALDIPKVDFIHQFPCFCGHSGLARFLSLYETFKKVEGLPGHYADVGTYKGASFLLIAKLIRIFEPHSSSMVHAFDWFKGMDPEQEASAANYVGSLETLSELVRLQELSDIAVINKVDLATDLNNLLESPKYAGIRFKYVYLDCGVESVLEHTLPLFYSRLVKGGVMLFDHYSTGITCESVLVDKYIHEKIQSIPFTRQPTGYIIKE